MKKTISYLAVIVSMLALTACGGGGGSAGLSYDGTTTAATIDSGNASALSKTSSQAISTTVEQDTANNANPFAVVASSSTGAAPVDPKILINLAKEIQSLNVPAGVTISYTDLGDPNYCGGTVSAPDNFGSGSMLNGTITINNLCYNDSYTGQITMNGSVVFTQTASQISMQYSNFTVTYGGQTYTFNMGLTCDTSFLNCSYNSDFTGEGGLVYRVADYSISGDPSTGLYFTGRFYHPTYGYVDITTNTAIIFGDCSGTQLPISGQVTITDGTNTVVITFNGCTSFSYTLNGGTAVVVNW